MPETPAKLYVLVRRDLSEGQQATQATHAALDFAVTYPDLVKAWHDESNYLIVLSVADEKELLSYADRAWDLGLRYSVFFEPDLDNTVTAVVIEPGRTTSKLCANLPLALREAVMV